MCVSPASASKCWKDKFDVPAYMAQGLSFLEQNSDQGGALSESMFQEMLRKVWWGVEREWACCLLGSSGN